MLVSSISQSATAAACGVVCTARNFAAPATLWKIFRRATTAAGTVSAALTWCVLPDIKVWVWDTVPLRDILEASLTFSFLCRFGTPSSRYALRDLGQVSTKAGGVCDATTNFTVRVMYLVQVSIPSCRLL